MRQHNNFGVTLNRKMAPLFNNPWLQIPASEYEGHMDSPAVRQGEFLNRFFADTLAKLKPPAVLVCGCTTGNGLEHIDPDITNRVASLFYMYHLFGFCQN